MSERAAVHAVLLAGGKGTRLYPYTAVFPKPLVPLGEMPVLEILLRRLQAHGLSDITICTGHLASLIRAFFGDGDKFGVNLRYVQEAEPLGTAGPIRLVPDLSDTFVVMNGDLLTTLDFRAILAHHAKMNADATIAVYPREVKVDFGVLEVDAGGFLADYREKPHFQYLVSMGVYVLNRSVMRFVPEDRRMDMPELILKIRDTGGKVACYSSDCYWLDIGRADDYAEAQRRFEQDPAFFVSDAVR